MKCQNCNAFFVRLPCPECSWKPEITETKTEKIETMVKPSELKGDSAVNPSQQVVEEEETLVKPSNRLKKENINKTGEELVKPSDYLKNKKEEKVKTAETLVKPSEYLKRHDQSNEESLVKPSELLGRTSTIKDVMSQDLGKEEERLLQPSKMGGMTYISKSTQPTQPAQVMKKTSTGGETLLRPSQLRGTSGRSSLQVKSLAKEDSISIKTIRSENEEFKSEVKDTLQEVISLLEKLMEQ